MKYVSSSAPQRRAPQMAQALSSATRRPTSAGAAGRSHGARASGPTSSRRAGDRHRPRGRRPSGDREMQLHADCAITLAARELPLRPAHVELGHPDPAGRTLRRRARSATRSGSRQGPARAAHRLLRSDRTSRAASRPPFPMLVEEFAGVRSDARSACARTRADAVDDVPVRRHVMTIAHRRTRECLRRDTCDMLAVALGRTGSRHHRHPRNLPGCRPRWPGSRSWASSGVLRRRPGRLRPAPERGVRGARGARDPHDPRQLRLRHRARPRGLRLRVRDPAGPRAGAARGAMDAAPYACAGQGLHAGAPVRPARRARAPCDPPRARLAAQGQRVLFEERRHRYTPVAAAEESGADFGHTTSVGGESAACGSSNRLGGKPKDGDRVPRSPCSRTPGPRDATIGASTKTRARSPSRFEPRAAGRYAASSRDA